MTEDEFRRGPSRDRRPSDLRSRLERIGTQLVTLLAEVRAGSASAVPADELFHCQEVLSAAGSSVWELRGALLDEAASRSDLPPPEPGARA